MKNHPLFVKRNRLNSTLERKLGTSGRIILFLDYDGTLVPIRRKPSLATLRPSLRSLLRRLAARPNITLCLVTGRSLADIRSKIRIKQLGFISNHGFEIAVGGSIWIHPAARIARHRLIGLASELKLTLKHIRNVFIENKRYTLTIHFRTVDRRLVPFVKEVVAHSVRPEAEFLKTTLGKKVVEVRPSVRWNKGYAVLRVLKSLARNRLPLIVYIGDDQTDEDAFRLLRNKGLTVVVGTRRKSAASFTLRNPQQVTRFLELLDTQLVRSANA